MLLAPFTVVFACVLATGVASAAASDVMRRTIPNWLCLALAAAGVAYTLIEGHGPWWAAVATGVAVLACGILPFALGWFGGGDVKLAAALAVWAGPAHVAEFLLVAAFAGGVLAGLALLMRSYPLPYLSTSPLFLDPRPDPAGGRADGMPYGVAIAAGGVWILYRMLGG